MIMIEFIVCLAVLNVMLTIVMFAIYVHQEYWYGTPKYFYKKKQMNLFGTVLCSTLMFILAWPIYVLLFLHWLCYIHITTKDQKKNNE